jgi:hypothetical protein
MEQGIIVFAFVQVIYLFAVISELSLRIVEAFFFFLPLLPISVYPHLIEK